MIKLSELRIGNLIACKKIIKDDKSCRVDAIMSPHAWVRYAYSNMHGLEDENVIPVDERDLRAIEITPDWLERLGFVEQRVCVTCAKINTSELCYNGSGWQGDYQFHEQAVANGKWIDCVEQKNATGHYSMRGFDIFQGKTIQHWSEKEAWNFSNTCWNLNLTIHYVHQLQNLYFALTGEELPLK